MWRCDTATCACTSAGRSAAPVLAACAITASGVFSAWARLPAWVRARATTSALVSSTWLKSLIRGWTSDGKSPSRRCACPSRTSLSARCMARSGARPTSTWASAANASSPSRINSDTFSTPRKRSIACAVSCRSPATIRRHCAAGASAARTVRSSISTGAPCGPSPSWTWVPPSAIASASSARLLSQSERDRSTPLRLWSSVLTRSSCQYRPENGRCQRGSDSACGSICGWPAASNASRAVSWSSCCVSVVSNWRITWSRNRPPSTTPASSSASVSAASVPSSRRTLSEPTQRFMAAAPGGNPGRARSRSARAAASCAGGPRRLRWCWSRARSPVRRCVR